MKFNKQWYLTLLILCISAGSFAQAYKTVSKTASAAYVFTANEFYSAAEDAARAKEMNGKVVEVTGKVIKVYSINPAGDLSKGKHYIHIEVPATETMPYASYFFCFFGTSQAALNGKQVTVKGEFLKKDAFTCLWHCVLVSVKE